MSFKQEIAVDSSEVETLISQSKETVTKLEVLQIKINSITKANEYDNYEEMTLDGLKEFSSQINDFKTIINTMIEATEVFNSDIEKIEEDVKKTVENTKGVKHEIQ